MKIEAEDRINLCFKMPFFFNLGSDIGSGQILAIYQKNDKW